MKILCTFPGKYGDLLWSLPSVRALSRRIGAPVDLMVAAPYGSICSLIEAQPYINRCWASPDWHIQDTAPISPRIPLVEGLGEYDEILNIGYRSWPLPDVCRHTLETLNLVFGDGKRGPIKEAQLALDEPWITLPPLEGSFIGYPVIAFSDEWFELKVGLVKLRHFTCIVLYPPGSRWATEFRGLQPESNGLDSTWLTSARCMEQAPFVLACCSALHVLAVAMGRNVLCVEPNPHRHADVFYPLGKTGRVRLLLGGDGLPTFDARHCNDAILEMFRASYR